MSKELNEYLTNMPVHVFKLVDGNTIIGKLIDSDENDVVIAKPHELGVLETSKNSMDVCINEWLYGCDAEEVLISQKNIITHSEASMTMKNFYSKCVLKTKIHQMVSDLNPKSKSVNPMNIFESLLNGLEQQDSRRDDYIGWDGHPKPWPPEEDI